MARGTGAGASPDATPWTDPLRAPTRAGQLRTVARNLWQTRGLRQFDRPPIVIGGCGRSGTTMLRNLLSVHPAICTYPKEAMFLCPGGYRGDLDVNRKPQTVRFMVSLLTYPVPTTARRWCYKTPKTVLFFPRLLRHFGEDIRLIHIVRDGRDVVTSRNPERDMGYWVAPERWVTDVGAGLQVRDDPRVHTLRYEDVISQPEVELDRLGAFLGEHLTELAANWHVEAKARGTKHKSKPLRPLYDSSIGRWREPAHAERIAELLAVPGAPTILAELGYTDA